MMNKIYRADFYNPYSNQSVTRDYLSVIETCLTELEIECCYVTALEHGKNTAFRVAVVITAKDAIHANRLGYGKILFWTQGIVPEESYMRHKSKLRYLVLSAIERTALRSADLIFMVSEEMRRHYEKKYRLKGLDIFIMPCFNEEIQREQFMCHNYEKNVFAYVGGLSVWQCFDRTVNLYKRIEEKYGDRVKLCILTPQQDEARKIIKGYKLKNWSVGYVDKEDIKSEMRNVKFGFCIRDDNKVNNVATPTKLSSYVCNGVLPIYSSCITDFHSIAKDNPFCLCEDESSFFEKLDRCMNENIDRDELYDEFNASFGRYYSKFELISGINRILKNLLEIQTD